MTAKAHLSSLHLRQAEHHIAKSKHHAALAEHYGTIAQEVPENSNRREGLQKIADAHKAMGEHHDGEADYHTKCAKTLRDSNKAMMSGDDDLDALAPLPAGLSRVVPTVRAVLRPGQRELPRDMDPTVAKVLGVGTDEGD